MRYPTTMEVAGVTVPVKVQEQPVFTCYKCPVCKDADDNTKPYIIYIPEGGDRVCPCCGCTTVQPADMYIWGAFDFLACDISISAPNEQAGGLNLVHETIEAINILCDLGMDHTAISTLGTQLYKAFASGNVDFTPRANVPGVKTIQ